MTEFEDLLKTDFVWPHTASDDDRNARVDPHSDGRLVLMITGYKDGADLLVQRAEESEYQRDSLIYPIIFNYRQFIELSLKYLIATYGHTVGIQANWQSHDIAFLWSVLVKVQAEYGDDDRDHTNPVVAKIIAEFSKIDPDSYAFRYPVDRSGKLIPAGLEELDLPILAKVMDRVAAYFDGCDGYLDHLQSAEP
jgi:hypothetical protein